MPSRYITLKDLSKPHREMLLGLALAMSDEGELSFADFADLIQKILKSEMEPEYPSPEAMTEIVRHLYREYTFRMWRRQFKNK